MFFTSKNEDNVVAVVFRILLLLKVKITRDTIIQYLKPHPDYHSLKSVCDFLNEIRVDNYPLRIDEEELFKLEAPFIAHLNEGQGKLIFISKITNESVTYADSSSGLKHSDTAKFLKTWSRAVILLEPSEKSGEAEYSQKRNEELIKTSIIPFVSVLFFLVCLTGILSGNIFSEQAPGFKFFILVLTKSTGLFFSLLLFRNELNIRTKFTDKLCHLSTNTDCNAVTKSKASRVFGSISWADVGIAYFTGGLIVLFIFPFTTVLQLFSILSIASLPYPAYSFLYQWLKIRKWCPLCISVQMVLICEFGILFNNIGIDSLLMPVLVNTFIAFSIVLIIVLLIKMLYIGLKEKDHYRLRLMKLKRDPAIFHNLIEKGEKIEIPKSRSSLIFGDIKSNLTITVFLSYYCSACAKKFPSIKRLIDNQPKVRIQMVFPASKEELSLKLTGIICSMHNSGNDEYIPELLDKWYNTGSKSKQKLLDQYKGEADPAQINEMMEYHSMLFNSGKIAHVPSVYVNGYSLPEMYELEEVKFFMDYLGKPTKEIMNVEV
jgi:hypothetical protein